MIPYLHKMRPNRSVSKPLAPQDTLASLKTKTSLSGISVILAAILKLELIGNTATQWTLIPNYLYLYGLTATANCQFQALQQMALNPIQTASDMRQPALVNYVTVVTARDPGMAPCPIRNQRQMKTLLQSL